MLRNYIPLYTHHDHFPLHVLNRIWFLTKATFESWARFLISLGKSGAENVKPGPGHSNVRPRPGFTFSIQNLKPGLQFVVKTWNGQLYKQIIVTFVRLVLSASKCLK